MIGFGQRVSYAFRSFFKILSSGELPRDVAGELVKPSASETEPAKTPATQVESSFELPIEKPPDSTDRAVQMLAILQRDGRLIDFFTEDIAPYSDAQIGAAVRELQQSCKQSLERYVQLAPVIA